MTTKKMTVREHLAAFLDEFALSQAHINAILDEMKAKDKTGLRWSDPTDAYPPPLMAVMQVSAKAAAVDWLERNAPNHWILPSLKA